MPGIRRALVEVGDNQDELSGECRWVVKALRQRAGIVDGTRPPGGADRLGNPRPDAGGAA